MTLPGPRVERSEDPAFLDQAEHVPVEDRSPFRERPTTPVPVRLPFPSGRTAGRPFTAAPPAMKASYSFYFLAVQRSSAFIRLTNLTNLVRLGSMFGYAPQRVFHLPGEG